MEAYNKQASEYIFRENNADGRVPPDTIDLHGQYVEEAEDILEERIRYARAHGENHLHVIVGKGNHSDGHIQKIRPRVEQVCRELGVQFHTEPNEGRIYVDLTGQGQGQQQQGYGYGQQQQQQQQYQQGYQQGYGQQQQHQQRPQQQHQQHQGQNDQVEKVVKKFLPRILNKLLRLLCH